MNSESLMITGRFTCGGAEDLVDFLLKKACRRLVLINRTDWPKYALAPFRFSRLNEINFSL
ncbi:hypothetical protein KOSB73_180093 [Klebsiella grimontii]|uniref:Uncharacterized protein n=1 Tax=Klebsiella grimontii TaxID=2058152 RepID=A0A285AWW7_9ENTR|nr:hypothetical protein KOSB73_180093 [Klebsiella grimontii]